MTETPTDPPQPEPPPARDARRGMGEDPPGWEEADSVAVPLRSGDVADLALARVMLTELRSLHQDHPERFAALLALSRGESVAEPHMQELAADAYYFRPDGTLKPLVRAVLISAAIETPEGVALREAVDLSGERERQAYGEQLGRFARNLRRSLGRPGADDTPGSGQVGPGV